MIILGLNIYDVTPESLSANANIAKKGDVVNVLVLAVYG